MEVPDLRDMVEDEVAHKDFEAQVVRQGNSLYQG